MFYAKSRKPITQLLTDVPPLLFFPDNGGKKETELKSSFERCVLSTVVAVFCDPPRVVSYLSVAERAERRTLTLYNIPKALRTS